MSKHKSIVIYSILLISKNSQSFEKFIKTAQKNRGGNTLRNAYNNQENKGFLMFFGARYRRVGGLGYTSYRALVALGRS